MHNLFSATTSELRQQYRAAALAHAGATNDGRHRVANRNYDLLTSIVQELHSRGSGEAVLTELLSDKELAVRLWAATHALPFATEAAERVLRDASVGPPSPLRLNAEITLSEWKAGRLGG